MKNTLPKWIDRFLEFILKDRFTDETIGDLHEWFQWKHSSLSSFTIVWLTIKTVVNVLKPYKIKTPKFLFFHLIDALMLSNNLKISLRSLLHNRLFTTINIIGLTCSLVSFLFIFAYVRHELSYDTFHPKKDHIYRVLEHHPGSGYRSEPTPSPLANAFLSPFPDAIEFARFGQDPVFIEVDDEQYYEGNFYWGDSSIFDFFELPFLYGNPSHALNQKNTLVLTQQVSEKYFGKGINPVGRSLPVKIYDGNQELLMRVDGVMKKLPANTDLPFEVLGSISNAFDLYSQFNNSWGFFWLHTYAYIPDEADLDRIRAQVPEVMKSALGRERSNNISVQFQPLSEVHLHSYNIGHALETGNIQYVVTFILIGIFIIVIATINYLNLMSAGVSKRRKEVGVRKVLGANKKQLFVQFLTESNLTILFSLILAIGLAGMLWPIFSRFIGKDIPLQVLLNWESALIFLAIVLLCGSLSGIYPAWVIASLSSSQAISKMELRTRQHRLQKLLVSLQFGISIFLIISATVIYQQIHFMSEKNLGFNQEQLISIKVEDRALQGKIEAIREQMSTLPQVAGSTISSESLPSEMNNSANMTWDDLTTHEGVLAHLISIDLHFFEILQIPFVHGNNFLSKSRDVEHYPVIMNRAAMDRIGKGNMVGEEINIDGISHPVIGVVEDYHYRPLQSEVVPSVFVVSQPGSRLSADNILLRLSTSNISSTLDDLETIWETFSTREFFSFHFAADTYQALYESERQFLKLFTFFAGLSIVISCIGLYGIVLFSMAEKSKEISLRKVFGSSTRQLAMLMTRRFILLILGGFVAGIPTALYFCTYWLDQFSYRIAITWWTVALSGILVLMIGGLTIGINTVKAALANPVHYLRSE